jgi:20S proteasome alpha/beta subunit
MTCCVAALCDKGKSIVLVADKMVGMGMIESEPEISKVFRIHKGWRVMLAGDDIAPAFPVIDSARHELRNARNGITVNRMMRVLRDCYQAQRLEIAEGVHLIPRGWTARTFNSPTSAILPSSLRAELGDKIQAQRLEVTLLVAGFDDDGKGHIFSLDDYEHRGQPRRHDIPGFHAIGSGSSGAMYMMTYREVSASMPLRLAMYYAIEGKYFGEKAAGVGLRTDVFVMRAAKPTFKLREKTLDDKIFKLCERLEPRKVRQPHVDILNSLSGEHFNDVPKLKTKHENGDFIIS